MSNSRRPPRPVCRYFSAGGCRAGSTCLYAHSSTLGQSPRQEKQICRFYNNGYCRRGDSCWFRHVVSTPTPASSLANQREETTKSNKEAEELLCSICFEEPTQFGLLTGCSHVFCLKCIQDWRCSKGKDNEVVMSNTNKTCPVCRAPSRFITPSSRFTPKDSPEREQCVKGYKSTLSRIPCKYFERSPPCNRFCPYGKDCFYQHQNSDGTPYVFSEGTDSMMEKHKAKMIASRAFPSPALMEAFMAGAGFGRHWIRTNLAYEHYESDDYEDFEGSDLSDEEWMPALMF
ncbi:hypothetical protein BDV93DRAFT_437901 [Ceratobasidium sp. AG-I]|nr:hypothetical protein BDV93DRAFT_437901 [Ceratobasidium sp. AG-I]